MGWPPGLLARLVQISLLEDYLQCIMISPLTHTAKGQLHRCIIQTAGI